MSAKSKSNELKVSRLYDAPVKAVWEAWADPEQLALWWGPRGFTLTTHSKDLRPGGHWTYTMHGPDGTNYPNKTLYHEVEKDSKLVYDHGGHDDRPPLFRVTVLFSETKGKTKMEMTLSFATPEAAEETRKFIKKANGDSTWDRLAEFLAKQSSGREKFVINRSFEAPIDVIYPMWTDPKHLCQWVPPTGFNMEYIDADIRPGGNSFYVMTGNGTKMYGRTHYLEFAKPNRVIYTQQFADEKGQVSRHPMAPTWPETMLTLVELTQEDAGHTRVTVTWEPHGQISREELDTFIQARGGMTGGWTGSFDKLEEYLMNHAIRRQRTRSEQY